jgi:predicted transcriptional regulator
LRRDCERAYNCNCKAEAVTQLKPTFMKSARAKINAAVGLISDALRFGRLWYTEIPHAIGYAKFHSRSHDAVIRVYDEAGSVIETHEHKGDFREW